VVQRSVQTAPAVTLVTTVALVIVFVIVALVVIALVAAVHIADKPRERPPSTGGCGGDDGAQINRPGPQGPF
jgi:hypothetical protein